MKNLLIIIGLLLAGLNGFGQKVSSDTLDYWSAYINDSLIGNYNTLSTDNEISLSKELINENDTISLIYGNDHPCTRCEYYYAVREMTNRVKLQVVRKKKILTKVSFSLNQLKTYIIRNEQFPSDFELFLHEDNYISENDPYTILYRLKIEK
jgi:hypothetical protein